MTATKKRTFCRVCEPACGLIATVDNDRLIALAPDREHPVSKGFVCNKGIYGLDVHNDPDRLTVPLKRVAPGQFEPVSWSEALGDIAARLRAILDAHGGSAVASYTGNPTAFNALYGPSFGNFIRQLGARKSFSSGTQDCSNKFAGSEAVFGTRTLHPLPDFERSDFILIIGENPAVSHMSFMSLPNPMAHLKAAERRGARVLYINPRRIESASMAGEVLHIRPDTDVYLLAALLHEIDRTVGFDADAVRSHGRNVAELRQFVAQYPPERVAEVTGIAEAEIRALARAFATAPSACAHMSTGVNMGRQGTLGYWLLHMLVFVTGNLGRPGGNFYSQGFYARSTASGRGAPEAFVDTPFGQIRKPGGVGISLPGTLMADYITEPGEPIRALFVNSGNPVLSIAGEARMRAALESLELLVCVDIYRNATAEYAHYILPAAGAFEREDINITGIGLQFTPSVQFTPAMVPAAGERKPDWWIYEQLSLHMGFDSAFDHSDQPDMWARVDAMLRSRGQSMAALRAADILTFERSTPESLFDEHLQTDDRQIDCFPALFSDAITRMATIFAEFEQAPADQLRLITKRDAYMMNSWYSNLPKMKKGREQNPLFMHPDDARLRQITDGQMVTISNRFGSVSAPVRLSDEVMPGVVAMTHGSGHGATRGMQVANAAPGVNCNVLLPSGPDSYEPLSNQAHMTGIPVDVALAS